MTRVALASLLAATFIAVSLSPASARWHHRPHGHFGGWFGFAGGVGYGDPPPAYAYPETGYEVPYYAQEDSGFYPSSDAYTEWEGPAYPSSRAYDEDERYGYAPDSREENDQNFEGEIATPDESASQGDRTNTQTRHYERAEPASDRRPSYSPKEETHRLEGDYTPPSGGASGDASASGE